MDRNEVRKRILDEVLELVPFDGWSETTLQAAGAAADVPGAEAVLAFPEGIEGVVDLFVECADEEMRQKLAALDLAEMKIRDKVTSAVRFRLEALIPNREAAQQLVSFLAMPHRLALGLRLTARTVDAIWRSIGDQSTDFNYYTKRATLSGVYTSTVLCWIGDDSEAFEETWAFLGRRIDDVMRFEKVKAQMRKFSEKVPTPFSIYDSVQRGERP